MPRVYDPPPPARSPWQLFYGAAHRLRRSLWARRSAGLPRPVVSVGNLHWGGTGKTPLVAAIAAQLRDRGQRVAILSRGYGRRAPGIRVVSDGGGPLLGPTVAGDEPVLLAGQLPGVGVVVGADRLRAGLHALERLTPAPEIFLLDDGFSHLRLARDVDLLAFPAVDPFGGGRLLPSGRLREPLASAVWADAVVLTGSGDDDDGERFARSLDRFGFNGPGFVSRTRALAPRLHDGGELPAGSTVLALAGIAARDRFEQTVRDLGFRVARILSFPDHHAYPPATLRRIARAWRDGSADAVLTTSKDLVKLLGRLDLPLAELPIRAEPEVGFWRWLEERLASLGGGG